MNNFVSLLRHTSRLASFTAQSSLRRSIFTLPETHVMLQKTCRDFAESELKPNAEKYDISETFPAEQVCFFLN